MTRIKSTAHLPEDYNEFNKVDLQVLCQANHTIYPCHSSVLGMHSSVLRGMFLSTPREQWGSGVGAAFLDQKPRFLEMWLVLIYQGSSSFEGTFFPAATFNAEAKSTLENFLGILHKLDCPRLLEDCDSMIASMPSSKLFSSYPAESFLGIANYYQLEKLSKRCARDFLWDTIEVMQECCEDRRKSSSELARMYTVQWQKEGMLTEHGAKAVVNALVEILLKGVEEKPDVAKELLGLVTQKDLETWMSTSSMD